MKRVLFCLFFGFGVSVVFIAGAASNPEGTPSSCTEDPETIPLGETKPRAEKVSGTGDCDVVQFELLGLKDGEKLFKDIIHYIPGEDVGYGVEECPEDEEGEPYKVTVPAEVTWQILFNDGTEKTGKGPFASDEWPEKSDSATCTFEIKDGEGPYSDSASFDFLATLKGKAYICKSGAHHSQHLGHLIKNCDPDINSLVATNRGVAVFSIEGLDDRYDDKNHYIGWFAGLVSGSAAMVVITNHTANDYAEMDVVDLLKVKVEGGCDCVSEGDYYETMAHTYDADYPTLQVKHLTNPSNYNSHVCWFVTSEKNEAEGGVKRSDGNVGDDMTGEEKNITAWFDCEDNKEKDDGEPEKGASYRFVALGDLDIVHPDNEKCEGPDENGAFGPGDTVKIVNYGYYPKDRQHALVYLRFEPDDPNANSNQDFVVSSTGLNEWAMKVPLECPKGQAFVELSDTAHECYRITNAIPISACACSSCDTFGQSDDETKSVWVSFGLGRNANGRPEPNVRFHLDRTDRLPDLVGRKCSDGNMVVEQLGDSMAISFRKRNENVDFSRYVLIPGPSVFTMEEYRYGMLRKITEWENAGGVWTRRTYAMATNGRTTDKKLSGSETLIKRDIGSTHIEKRIDGDRVTETEWTRLASGNMFKVRETIGEGEHAESSYFAPLKSGANPEAVHSEIHYNGSWIWYNYDAMGRIVAETTPYGDAEPITDGSHRITGFRGMAAKTEYAYLSVDPKDDLSLHDNDARTIVRYVGNDSDGWTEISRSYTAHYLENNEVRVVVEEQAAAPGAAYGAPGNRRTVTRYHYKNANAGRMISRTSPEGMVTLYKYQSAFLAASGVPELVDPDAGGVPVYVTDSYTVPASTCQPVPFKTLVNRSIRNRRGDVLAEVRLVFTNQANANEIVSWTRYTRDYAGHMLKSEDSTGKVVEQTWACCGLETSIDANGAQVNYVYDAQGRVSIETRGSITSMKEYDFGGNVTNTVRIGAKPGSPSLSVSSSAMYDDCGRIAWSIGEDGVRTDYIYGNAAKAMVPAEALGGGEVRVTIRGAGTDCAVTNATVMYRDGSLKCSYRNGRLVEHEVRTPFSTASYAGTNGVNSLRVTRSYSDYLGRTVASVSPAFGGAELVSSNEYDSVGRLVASRTFARQGGTMAPVSAQLYGYNELGERILSVRDVDFDGTADFAGADVITSNDYRYVKNNGSWWKEQSVYSWHEDNSAAGRLESVTLVRQTGLGGGADASVEGIDGIEGAIKVAEGISFDQRGNASRFSTWIDRANRREFSIRSMDGIEGKAISVSVDGLAAKDVSQSGVVNEYAYDALNRQISQTDGRGNMSRTVYDGFGRVVKTVDAAGNETSFGYDALGRRNSVTDPLGQVVISRFDADGNIVSQRGAMYPVDYSYDEFGNKVSMTTYRDASGEGDTTRWLRDEATGLVTNKVYADGKGTSYTYTPDGKLAKRTWARGVVTTYSYDANGALTNTVYSDGTPAVSLVYNRAGRQIEARDAAGVTTFLYDEFGSLTNETVIGVAGTNVIERFYDEFGRSTGYSLNGVRQSTLGYDAATGRLASMLAAGSDTPFTWSYLAGSDMKASLAYPNGMTASWTYGDRNELLEVKNALGDNVVSQFNYSYDATGRRISKNGEFYSYNERSELTGAVDEAAGREYGYAFDDIGNRESAIENSVTNRYSANALNQYSAVDDFTPQYNDDGNQTLVQTSTGIWQVQYNGENRPVQWRLINSPTPNSSTPTLISMAFDRMGRRVTKNDQRFVYDGYLQIANFERASTNSQLTTHNSQLFIWDPTEKVATRPLVWNRNGELSFYTHDGNKNVSEVIASNGTLAAHYECAPFGAITVKSGEYAEENPWRFSSEYADDALGLVYYNYRHYEPVMGRWLSRDPVEENTSINLRAFVSNHVVLNFDVLGLASNQKSSCGPCGKDLVFVSNSSDYDNFENDVRNHYRGSDGKSHSFKSVEEFDPNSKIEKDECVCHLLVGMHGGGDSSGAVAGTNNSKLTLSESNNRRDISNLFSGVRFCDGCKITLMSCLIGSYRPLVERIAANTGCKVTAYATTVDWSGPSIIDKLAGWNFNPEVTVSLDEDVVLSEGR